MLGTSIDVWLNLEKTYNYFNIIGEECHYPVEIYMG